MVLPANRVFWGGYPSSRMRGSLLVERLFFSTEKGKNKAEEDQQKAVRTKVSQPPVKEIMFYALV